MLPLHRNRIALVVPVALVCGLLSACADGVQLEGKLFDMLGVSGSDSKSRDPKMTDRAPLVVPPRLTRLPEPGSGKTADASVAALNDPELRKQATAKERERLHLAYCRGEIQWKEKAFDQNSGANRSPYGPCPGLFSGATDKLTQ